MYDEWKKIQPFFKIKNDPVLFERDLLPLEKGPICFKAGIGTLRKEPIRKLAKVVSL